jgi:hypothetical protein
MTNADTIRGGSLVTWPTATAGEGLSRFQQLPNEVIDLKGVLDRVEAEELPHEAGREAIRNFARICAGIQHYAVTRGFNDFATAAATNQAAAVDLLNLAEPWVSA